MGLSRSGTLFLIGLLALIGLSLHPVAGVEAFVGALFAPSRVLSELALPLRWVGAKSVRASEEQMNAAAPTERERSHALLLASQAAAMPADETLQRGRALVGAHVIDRPDKMRDRLILRFPPDAGVAVGMPVVCGDVFVGRVTELDPRRPGECVADIVTARGFRVAAAIDTKGSTQRIVVGGILGDPKNKKSGMHLAAQFPKDRAQKNGDLRVAEEEIAGAAHDDAHLADGFRLGLLEPVMVRDVELLGVVPLLDYVSGLSQLAIVCPPQMSTAGPVLAVDPFDEAAWVDARVLLAGDPSPRRGTRKLALRASSRVRAGAALAVGPRFVGRVEDVSAWAADARLLSDVGTSFHALARVDGIEAPITLGKLVSRGADGPDAVALEWAATIPVADGSGDPVRAELWTAAGEPDVPPGLLVGTALLPRGRGPFVLHVVLAQDPRDALHFAAWRGRKLETEAP